MNIDFGLSTWKPTVFSDTLSLYAGDLCDYSGITGLTTPFSFSSVTTSSSNSGSTFSNLSSSFSNLNNYGSFGYSSNNSLYGYGNTYDVMMDMYFNMQEYGVKYPSLMGKRTRNAGDYINEISMWNDMDIKDVLCGQFNKFTAFGVEQIFTNLLS